MTTMMMMTRINWKDFKSVYLIRHELVMLIDLVDDFLFEVSGCGRKSVSYPVFLFLLFLLFFVCRCFLLVSFFFKGRERESERLDVGL